MQRNCDSCGEVYEAKRATSKYCGSACRMRVSRGQSVDPPPESDAASAEVDAVTGATRSELEAADRLTSALGQAAMALARRIDTSRDTGSAFAQLVKEHRSALAAATAGARTRQSDVHDLQDELAARRARSAG